MNSEDEFIFWCVGEYCKIMIGWVIKLVVDLGIRMNEVMLVVINYMLSLIIIVVVVVDKK